MKRDKLNTLVIYIDVSALIISIIAIIIAVANHRAATIGVTIAIVTCVFIAITFVAAYFVKKQDRSRSDAAAYRSAAFSKASLDIRTLMNSILNLSSPELTENFNPTEMMNSLNKINNASEYLMTVINDLMVTYKVTDDQFALKENPSTIENIIDPIADLMRERFEQKGQAFTVEYDNVDKFRYVLVDATRVQQIIMDLLSNAHKYTPESGHIDLKIEGVNPSDDGIDIKISVKDDGEGMSRKKLSTLFDTDPQEPKDHGHFELGLSIVASLVKEMKGRITCESEPHKGSEFIVSFHWSYCNKDSYASSNHDFSALEGKNILVVEDNAMNAEITKAILEKKGMMMDYAKDGEEGVAMFTHAMPHTYDAILMDIRMPIMDGIEASKKIRGSNHPEGNRVPIIAMTADVFDADYKSSSDAGMDAYITKPLDPDELYVALSNAIRS